MVEVISAGGVVFRTSRSREILVGKRMRDVEPKWRPILVQLPKGTCEVGESYEAAALREVMEETGFRTRIVGDAGTASWQYKRAGRTVRETVHYFLMQLIDSAPMRRDAEFDELAWVSMEDAVRHLSYPEEKELIRRLATSRSDVSAST